MSLNEHHKLDLYTYFYIPIYISNDLARFLGKTRRTRMNRNDISSEIQNYIRTNNLHCSNNIRIIDPDVKLATLFNMSSEDTLNIYNIQIYICKITN
jgi:chromatin remodeling complex protein RSC6